MSETHHPLIRKAIVTRPILSWYTAIAVTAILVINIWGMVT